ncbi:MAG: hypothetical protein M1819_000081 [Sarea resinae]|nr:MAG: hypothetical protein M1819_000081 [Sarea resinae]
MSPPLQQDAPSQTPRLVGEGVADHEEDLARGTAPPQEPENVKSTDTGANPIAEEAEATMGSEMPKPEGASQRPVKTVEDEGFTTDKHAQSNGLEGEIRELSLSPASKQETAATGTPPPNQEASTTDISEKTDLERTRSPTPPPPPPKDDLYYDPTPKTPLESKPPSRAPSTVASHNGGTEELLAFPRSAVVQNARDVGDQGIEQQELAFPRGANGRHAKDAEYHSEQDLASPRSADVQNEKDAITEQELAFPRSGDGRDAKDAVSDQSGAVADSRSEIQSIMDQFQHHGGGLGEEDALSPRLERQSTIMANPHQFPPRKSSLEPITGLQTSQINATQAQQTVSPSAQPSPILDQDIPRPTIRAFSQSHNPLKYDPDKSSPSTPVSSRVSSAVHKPPPPDPDPEPDLPFDFHRFLEQLRHRTADPVAKFLRSFLSEFGKKQWMVHEQEKIIADFLAFITNKMAQCEVWKGVSDAEFDNAREGMEKLVMNRLYTQTFSPAIPPPQPIPVGKGKRKGEPPLGPGRRGQHQEDVERDDILAQKVRIYGWVREEHLDIHPVGESGRKFLHLAQQELLKIKTYRAPRDKVICVLNCCKVIFGLLRNAKSDQSADSFVPLLIYVVLKANPEHLVSNVQYILRFRNQDKLGGEAGYYLSSLMGAVQFIENLDRTNLTVSDEEFERNVEAAVSAIAERHEEDSLAPPQVHVPEKSTLSRPEVTPRNSMEAEYSTMRRSLSSREAMDGSGGSDSAEDKATVTGLLRTIQRPLSSLGRMLSEDPQSAPEASTSQGPSRVPQPGASPRLSPVPQQPQQQRNSEETRRRQLRPLETGAAQTGEANRLNAADAAARQASAETAEAQRIQRAEHKDVVETLSGMFPGLDKDVIDDVVRMKEGRVGLAVDACLALSS